METLQELLVASLDFEMISVEENASAEDDDLMRIKCFGTHEGVNFNNVEFPRSVLMTSYLSFVDKPVVIVNDKFNMPTGHGYDYKKQKYNEKDRKYIGHIVNAYPVIVKPNGEFDRFYCNDIEIDKVQGELRIVCDLVVYKKYMKEIADNLALLHMKKKLKFSMESVVDYVEGDDGVKHCTKIHFTGLCVVENPAFKNSTGLLVAEEQEEKLMDFEQMYNDLNSNYQALVAEKATLTADKANLTAEKESLQAELDTAREDLATEKGKVADAQASIEELKTYKEKVEAAERQAIGEERYEKLKKYGEPKQTKEELAEMDKASFVDVLAEAVENYKPSGYRGLPTGSDEKSDRKNRLMEILNEF